MNEIIYSFRENKVRVVELNGEPWFVAKDVCDVLEINNPSQAISRLDDDEKNTIILNEGIGNPNKSVVNEYGLYNLIFNSRKPEAREFKRWVTHEVLPEIRKNGAYVKANEEDDDEIILAKAVMAAQRAIERKDRMILLQKEKLEMQRPKVLFADAVEASETSILIGQLAKLLTQNGVHLGQNRLFAWLRENGYLCKKGANYNEPTQYSVERGWFETTERTINNPDGSVRITRTTKVTGKGQVYFMNKFLKKEVI